MTRAWHEEHPELAEEIRADLRAAYPSLHLVIRPGAPARVMGTFPVRSREGVELDSYRVCFEFPSDYPISAPSVKEVGGRIPRTEDRHINADGTACVFIPEERSRHFPIGARFRQLLEGPIHDYFLSQALVERGEPWPFDQWRHREVGRRDFYREAIGTEDDRVVDRVVYMLAQPLLNHRSDCPCGSGMKLRDCCIERIRTLRERIPSEVAEAAMRDMGITRPPYKGRRLR